MRDVYPRPAGNNLMDIRRALFRGGDGYLAMSFVVWRYAGGHDYCSLLFFEPYS